MHFAVLFGREWVWEWVWVWEWEWEGEWEWEWLIELYFCRKN